MIKINSKITIENGEQFKVKKINTLTIECKKIPNGIKATKFTDPDGMVLFQRDEAERKIVNRAWSYQPPLTTSDVILRAYYVIAFCTIAYLLYNIFAV